MASGVGVDEMCITAFQELKLKKKYRYIMYKLSDDSKLIQVENLADPATTYDAFLNQLPKDDCRYAVYDFQYEIPNEGLRSKICFYTWSPENAKIKSKMLYASSKDAIRKKLVGIANEIQGTDFSEVSYQTVLDRLT